MRQGTVTERPIECSNHGFRLLELGSVNLFRKNTKKRFLHLISVELVISFVDLYNEQNFGQTINEKN